MAWVCEFSPLQGAFHVDLLASALEKNRRALAAGKNPGYIPLAVVRSSEEANVFVEKWRREHPWKGATYGE